MRACRHLPNIKGEVLHIVLSTPVYLFLALALILVLGGVVLAVLVYELAGDLIRRLYMHPFEFSESVGYSLLLARHLALEVHVGLWYLVADPLVRQTQFVQSLPVLSFSLEVFHEEALAPRQVLVHSDRVYQLLSERLVVALGRIVVPGLRHVARLLILVANSVLRRALLVLLGEGKRVGRDIVRGVLGPFGEDHVRLGVPEGRLQEVALG